MTAIDISAFTEGISDRNLERLCTDNPLSLSREDVLPSLEVSLQDVFE